MGRGKSAIRPILKNMRRAIAILAASILFGPVGAGAQSQTPPPTPTPQTLADVARAEEARRKNAGKATKVFTNTDLKPDTSTPVPQAAPSPEAPIPSTKVPEINLPGGTGAEPPAEGRDQAYWSARMTTAQEAVERSRLFADSLQSRINALRTDFVNRDDPAQRAVIETNLKTALAELDRVQKEMETQQKEIAVIQDEARRAGVPSGWLRPGV